MRTKKNLTERAKNGRNGCQFVYVLECIRSCGRASDEGLEFKTDKEALDFFISCFNEEFNNQYNKRRFPSLQERIGEYLQGLPSCFNVDFYEDDIIRLGIIWEVLKNEEDKKKGKFVANFFSVLGCRILQACRKVGINVYQYAI